MCVYSLTGVGLRSGPPTIYSEQQAAKFIMLGLVVVSGRPTATTGGLAGGIKWHQAASKAALYTALCLRLPFFFPSFPILHRQLIWRARYQSRLGLFISHAGSLASLASPCSSSLTRRHPPLPPAAEAAAQSLCCRSLTRSGAIYLVASSSFGECCITTAILRYSSAIR